MLKIFLLLRNKICSNYVILKWVRTVWMAVWRRTIQNAREEFYIKNWTLNCANRFKSETKYVIFFITCGLKSEPWVEFIFKVPKCNILSVTLEILVIWRTNENANFIPRWVGDKSEALYALQIRWKGLSNLHSSLQYAAIKKILGCGCVPFSFIWFNH